MSDFKPPAGPPPGYEEHLPQHYPQEPPQQKQQQPEQQRSLYPPQNQSAANSSSPSPGAVASASSSSSGFLAGLKNHFMPRKPLDPPPPSFGRPTPAPSPQYTYAPFPPLVLMSKGPVVADGFSILPPNPPPGAPPIQGPHPFVLHDVNEDDWKRFLEDLKIQGGLTGGDQLRTNLVPMALSVSTPVGFLLTRAMQKGAKQKKSGVVAELVDVWNQQFFGPRRMRVFLAKGMHIYNPTTQQAMQPADMMYLPQDVQGQQLHRIESWSSSSSSSSDSSNEGQHRQQAYGQAPPPPQAYGGAPAPYGGPPAPYGGSPAPYGTPPPQAGYYGAPPQPGYYNSPPPQQGYYGSPSPQPQPNYSSPSAFGGGRHGRREAKEARRSDRRAWKEERRELKHRDRDLYRERKRERKHGRKAEKHEKFRLVVVPV